jgi:diamine N-acetyltransferase
MRDISFSVRPATIADYDELCNVWEVGDALHRQALPNIFQASIGPSQERTKVEALIAGPQSAIFVAESCGEVIGLITILVRNVSGPAIKVSRQYVEIYNMAVKVSVQRQGVGRALIDAANDWARQRGITELELNVYEFNRRAKEFYRAMGFSTVSRRMRRRI